VCGIKLHGRIGGYWIDEPIIAERGTGFEPQQCYAPLCQTVTGAAKDTFLSLWGVPSWFNKG